MDDEVEYLGTILAPSATCPCDSQQPVTGITLHIETCGGKLAHSTSFFKTRTSHVNIGRKSISDDRSMRKENDDQNAVFACPVVSAKHAKLVLAASGHVYIVDLKSRHGTHVRKQGETVSRMLQPEVETTLTDGDIVTFGKAVGQGASLVSPVTARIEFMHDILDIRDTPPWHLPADSLSHELRLRKLSSGRYGLNSPISYHSSPSSESLSSSPSGSSNQAVSHSEHDSDIEPMPWEELRSCVSLRQDFSADFLGGSLLGKIPSLGTLMQDICHKITDPLDIESPQPWTPPAIVSIDDDDDDVNDGDDDAPSSPDRLPNSRSHSPMELSTPSPSPPEEPEVVGAWPESRDQSPQPASRRLDESNRVKLPSMCSFGHMVPIESGPLFESFPERLPSLSNIQPILEDAILPPVPVLPSIVEVRSDELQDNGHGDHGYLRDSIKTVEERVNTLQSSVDDIKNRHALTEDDLYDLQHQVDTMEPESDRLLTRLEAAEDKLSSLSDLQDQVSDLQSRFDAESSEMLESPMTDVKACADALNALVIEMKALREETEKRVEERIHTIQTAKTEALSIIAAEVETFKSLKRKHSEIEVAPEVAPLPAKMDIVVETPAAVVAPVVEEHRHKKRPRRIVSSVARTTAAMAVGAVATWSALAFS